MAKVYAQAQGQGGMPGGMPGEAGMGATENVSEPTIEEVD